VPLLRGRTQTLREKKQKEIQVKHGCEACRTMRKEHRIHGYLGGVGLCRWHGWGELMYGHTSVADALSDLGHSYKLDPKRFCDAFGGRA
jgi:hypothetical protein